MPPPICLLYTSHKDISDSLIQELLAALKQYQVKIHADSRICDLDADCIPATEEDYGREYLDLEISIKTISSLEEEMCIRDSLYAMAMQRVQQHFCQSSRKQSFTFLGSFVPRLLRFHPVQ